MPQVDKQASFDNQARVDKHLGEDNQAAVDKQPGKDNQAAVNNQVMDSQHRVISQACSQVCRCLMVQLIYYLLKELMMSMKNWSPLVDRNDWRMMSQTFSEYNLK